MSTFLMTTPAATGHLLRILELAQGLSARGHRVLVHSEPSAEPAVRAAGATLVPYGGYTNIIMRLTAPPAGAVAWLPRIPRNLLRFREALLTSSVDLARELEPILRREQVDCLVYDTFGFGAAYAAERAGIPHASAGNAASILGEGWVPLVSDGLPPVRLLAQRPKLLHGMVDRLLPLARARDEVGLPPRAPGGPAEFVRAVSSDALHIVMAHRGFAGDARLRDNQLFAGPVSFNLPSAPRPDASPSPLEPGTVLVSTTTTGKDAGLLRRVLEAIAPMGIPILATAASAEDIPRGLGAHVRIEQYIPHDEVFPRAAALITHGGWGTVGRALVHGLPMLIIPLFGDQLMNGRQAEKGGFGYHLPLGKATPEAIRGRLRALLADNAHRDRMKKVSAEIAELKANAVAEQALEELAKKAR